MQQSSHNAMNYSYIYVCVNYSYICVCVNTFIYIFSHLACVLHTGEREDPTVSIVSSSNPPCVMNSACSPHWMCVVHFPRCWPGGLCTLCSICKPRLAQIFKAEKLLSVFSILKLTNSTSSALGGHSSGRLRTQTPAWTEAEKGKAFMAQV